MSSSYAMTVMQEEGRRGGERSLRACCGRAASGENAVGERRRDGESGQLGGPDRKREQPTPHSNLSLSHQPQPPSFHREPRRRKTNSKILRDLAFHPATLRPVCPRMRPRNTASSGGSDSLGVLRCAQLGEDEKFGV
jgi:hypothetical protein